MTESDNQFFNIDVFGSWMDVGLAVGMFVIGFAFVFKSILGLRKSKGCSPFKQQSIAVHSRVHEQLTELRVLTGAGRAQICMFHNGGTFESGSSMKKFSVTHESLALAIESTLQKKKEMVVSAFTHLIEHVSKDDPSNGRLFLEVVFGITKSLDDMQSSYFLSSKGNHSGLPMFRVV